MILHIIDHLLKLYKEENYEKLLQDSSKFKPKDDSEYCIIYQYKALALMNLERFEEAANEFKKLVEKDPTITINYYNLGDCLSKIGKNEQAFENYDIAISLEPNNPFYYDSKAGLLNKIGLYEEALDCANRGLEISPTNTGLLVNKMIACEYLGFLEDALNAVEKILKIDPNCGFSDIRESLLKELGKL